MVSGYYIWIHRSDIKSRGNSVLVSCLLRRTIWLSRIQCHIWGTVAGLDTSGEVHFQEVSSQHLCNEQQWCLTSASIGTSHRLSAATPTTIAAPSQYTFNVAAIGCCALALVLFDWGALSTKTFALALLRGSGSNYFSSKLPFWRLRAVGIQGSHLRFMRNGRDASDLSVRTCPRHWESWHHLSSHLGRAAPCLFLPGSLVTCAPPFPCAHADPLARGTGRVLA